MPPECAASISSSVSATERLKFSSEPGSDLAATNSSMSGCEQSSTAMLAPRRRPPCLTTSVAASKMRMKETGPLATPRVVRTRSPLRRRREKENPVPPPAWWIRAISCSAVKIESSESSIGRTKQPESRPISVPAFISVGEFGRKSRPFRAAANRSLHRPDEPGAKRSSAAATCAATRSIISAVDSATLPASSASR